jgi:hypothetical protein
VSSSYAYSIVKLERLQKETDLDCILVDPFLRH